MPSTLFPVHNWLKDVPDKDKRDRLPGCSMLLLSHFCNYREALKPGFCKSVAQYQPAGHWDELGRLPPVCDAKHKKHCCGMKTLGLKGENFTGSGERLLWKTSVNNHLPAPTVPLGGCAACRKDVLQHCFPRPDVILHAESSKTFTPIAVALIHYLISLGPPDCGAWTELQPALPARMPIGPRRACLHQVMLLQGMFPLLLPVSSGMQTPLLFMYHSARALSSPACFSFTSCLLHASTGSCSCRSFPWQTVYCWDLCNSLWNVHVLAEPQPRSCQQSQPTSRKPSFVSRGESWFGHSLLS